MKMENNFYGIEAYDKLEQGAVARLRLNGEHAIYGAHFPGQPVTPGVCIVQMLTELAEKRLEKGLLLRGAKNIKFLAPMLPEARPTFSFTYKTEAGANGKTRYAVKADISEGSCTYARISVMYE